GCGGRRPGSPRPRESSAGRCPPSGPLVAWPAQAVNLHSIAHLPTRVKSTCPRSLRLDRPPPLLLSLADFSARALTVPRDGGGNDPSAQPAALCRLFALGPPADGRRLALRLLPPLRVGAAARPEGPARVLPLLAAAAPGAAAGRRGLPRGGSVSHRPAAPLP